jgi:hypothetical protein
MPENQVNELIFAAFTAALALQRFDEDGSGKSICGGCFHNVKEWRNVDEHKANCPVSYVIVAANALLVTPL